MAQRVGSALVLRESDPEQPPFRRPSTAAFGSIAIAVVALAAVAVYGLIVPGGNDAWRSGDSVIVVEETGTRYVYLDGHLHPVRNYASALLALGSHAETVSVSRDSLAGVPRGPRIGIPGAPDALPAPDRVSESGWTLCSRPIAGPTGATVDTSMLLAGAQPAGGRALDDTAVLVEVVPRSAVYLLWHGYRHLIQDLDTVSVGLALYSVPRVRAGTEFLDIVPAGADIAPLPVPDAGAPSTAVPRRPDIRVGQLLRLHTSGGAVQHYLAGAQRLRPISELQFDIQLAYHQTADAYGESGPIGISLGPVAAAAAARGATPPRPLDAAPPRRPDFIAVDQASTVLCASYDPGSFVPRLLIEPRLPAPDELSQTPGSTPEGTALADRVYVRPGGAALVRALPSAEAAATAGTLVLVTDQGRGYPLASPEVLDILGYADVDPVALPAALVARIPTGRGLDPSAAMSS